MSSTAPNAVAMRQLVAQWRDWLATHTDTLLTLEDRARGAGTADDKADIAAAFVARKAIAARLDAVEALVAKDRARAAALAEQPVTDDLEGPVGRNLRDAADLLEAVLAKVSRSIAERETAQHEHAVRAAAAEADLAVCHRLAAELGLLAARVADLGQRLAARTDLAAVAADLADTRAGLEAAVAERATLRARWAALPEHVEALMAQEAAVRELAARCREKVVQAPPLAVPSVAGLATAVGEHAGVTDLDTLPWPAQRALLAPLLQQADRVAAALAEADRRFRSPLQRRDELRGLLQAFADKAVRQGAMAVTAVEHAYGRAKAALWTAPCDLEHSGRLVDSFVAAVNAQGVPT